jgi:hypothetical protein
VANFGKVVHPEVARTAPTSLPQAHLSGLAGQAPTDPVVPALRWRSAAARGDRVRGRPGRTRKLGGWPGAEGRTVEGEDGVERAGVRQWSVGGESIALVQEISCLSVRPLDPIPGARSRWQGKESSQGSQAPRGGYRVERADLIGARESRGAGVAGAGGRGGAQVDPGSRRGEVPAA